MKTPTLEEVKEYFKNAKEVKCLWDGKIYNISSWKLYKDECGFRYAENKKAENEGFCGVFGIGEYKKFAEIISYKDTYTVSKDFILEAHESACSTLKTKIENQFPELFPKVELEIGKWYKNNDINYEKSIACVVELDKENKREFMGYGFDCDGDFRPLADDCVWGSNSWTLATKEEVETALIAEAKRRGFEDGVIYLSPKLKIKRTFSGEFNYYSDNNSLSDKNSGMIFNKGVWAEIISEPIELSLEQRLERIEKHLNIN